MAPYALFFVDDEDEEEELLPSLFVVHVERNRIISYKELGRVSLYLSLSLFSHQYICINILIA